MREIKLGETRYFDIAVSGSTGAAMDADSAPTVVVFEDATDTPILSLASTKRTSLTGKYRRQVDFTSGNGCEVGKCYAVYVDATVSGLATHTLIGTFIVRANSIDDLALAATALSTAQWTNTRAGLLDFLDAAITSRLATAGYTAPANSDVAAIKAKTDNLPANPASQTNLDVAVSTRLAAAGYTAPDNAGIGSAATASAAAAAGAAIFVGMTEDASGRRFTAHALETAPSGGGGGGSGAPVEVRSEDRTVRS